MAVQCTSPVCLLVVGCWSLQEEGEGGGGREGGSKGGMGREGELGRKEGVKEGWGERGGKGRKGRSGVCTIFTSSVPHSLSTSVPPYQISLILPIPILEYGRPIPIPLCQYALEKLSSLISIHTEMLPKLS